uniref:Chromophore lyase CpcS/CpeS n=1 Tax=Plocamium cartilagineum TaxID=31452 RepID=A0A1C9CHQ2_PLOCA|nr:hypothetical protein Plocam_053 [Plocamium cartilagineum]AOM67889.1 hypothetical protein Plocam_053 [Plocamium cartilagineum]
MKQKLQSFLEKIEGIWLSQRTIYCLKTKNFYNNYSKVNISKQNNLRKSNLERNEIYYYKDLNTSGNNYIYNFISKSFPFNEGLIRKNTNKYIENYKYKIYSINCLQIESIKKHIEYIEYIYFINKNFRISITTIKKLKKYLYISFSSEIKVINN